MVEATGVEPAQVLKTRKLLILRTDKKAQKGYISDYCMQNAYKKPDALKLLISSIFRIAYHKAKHSLV